MKDLIKSLEAQLPCGWRLILYSGGALYSDLRFDQRFIIFPVKKIITYDDITRPEGLRLLRKAVRMVMIGDFKKAREHNIGSCVYNKGL